MKKIAGSVRSRWTFHKWRSSQGTVDSDMLADSIYIILDQTSKKKEKKEKKKASQMVTKEKDLRKM